MKELEGTLYKVDARVIELAILVGDTLYRGRVGVDIQQEDAAKYYALIGKTIQVKIDAKNVIKEIRTISEE